MLMDRRIAYYLKLSVKNVFVHATPFSGVIPDQLIDDRSVVQKCSLNVGLLRYLRILIIESDTESK